MLYTQHFQRHCFRLRSANLGVAYAVCYFYNTNKFSLCVHRLRTHHTLCSKSWTKIMLVIHVLPNEVRLAIRDFVQTDIHTPIQTCTYGYMRVNTYLLHGAESFLRS